MVVIRRISLFKRVFAEASDLVRGSNLWFRARSYAASVPSDAIQKSRKRIPVGERKVMVESYVNKYRATNSGKFPTPSEARRQVGGSYYVVKKIVQELEYQCRITSTSTMDKNSHQDAQTRDGTLVVKAASITEDTRNSENAQTSASIEFDSDHPKAKDRLMSNFVETNAVCEAEKSSIDPIALDVEIPKDTAVQIDAQTSLETKVANKSESLIEVEELVLSQTKIDLGFPATNRTSVDKADRTSTDNVVDSDLSRATDMLTSNFVEKTSLNENETPPDAIDTSEGTKQETKQLKEGVSFHPSSDKAEDTVNKKGVTEHMPEVDTPKNKVDQLHQAQNFETIKRDLPEVHGDDAEPQKKSSVWGNLKSFADGIANFWRNL